MTEPQVQRTIAEFINQKLDIDKDKSVRDASANE